MNRVDKKTPKYYRDICQAFPPDFNFKLEAALQCSPYTIEDLKTYGNAPKYALWRHLIATFYIMSTNSTLEDAGRLMARDHASILNGIRKICFALQHPKADRQLHEIIQMVIIESKNTSVYSLDHNVNEIISAVSIENEICNKLKELTA